LYHLHFDNLCADFQEDIRFRFSLGFTAMFQRFLTSASTLQKRNNSSGDSGFQNMKRGADVNRPGSGLSRELSSPQFSVPPVASLGNNIVPDDWSIVSKVAIAAISSQGTMGGLLVGGLLLKTVGWRAIAITTAIYGGLYMYERLTWTHTAKCREFKRQYVEHAARKLRLVVDMTSANCSHQVQQELSSTFARLCHLVDETTMDLKEGIDSVDETLSRLDEGANRSKVLKNQANFIANKLDLFDRSYLHLMEEN
jgi:mitofusin